MGRAEGSARDQAKGKGRGRGSAPTTWWNSLSSQPNLHRFLCRVHYVGMPVALLHLPNEVLRHIANILGSRTLSLTCHRLWMELPKHLHYYVASQRPFCHCLAALHEYRALLHSFVLKVPPNKLRGRVPSPCSKVLPLSLQKGLNFISSPKCISLCR